MRASAVILALVGLLIPLAAPGVGLGELESDAYIEEPFQGRIELLDVERDQLDGITARLAPREDFRAAELERTGTARALEFEPVWEEGRAYLRVTTSRPVARSFLDFMVELEWPAGRQVRAYTVLLDPPDTTEEETAAVEAPAASSEAPPSAPAGEQGLEYGQVQEGERLWNIAEKLRQRVGGEVTTEQVAMALLRDNREAFQGNNVNRLMAGYVLRIEDAGSIDEVAAGEAETEFWRQYRAWQDFRQSRAEEAARRPSEGAAKSAAEGGDGEAASEGSGDGGGAPSGLTLEGPEAMATGEAEAPGSGGEAAENPRVQELRNELDTALAEVEDRREGNEALRERLKAMEEQLQSMERLLEVDSGELAALQGEDEGGRSTDELGVFLDLLNRHPQWVGVAGGLLILLLALVWVAARRHAGGEVEKGPRHRREGSGQAEAEQPAPHSEDPVTEADIYFSMGRYAEAVDVLEKAIAHHPRHAEYRRRLAEIHHGHGNREAFLREARSMHQELGESAPMEWARVAALGATMAPDDPLFAQQPGTGQGSAETSGGTSSPETSPSAEKGNAESTDHRESAQGGSEGSPADEEDEERIDASLEDEFAELMGEGDHRAEWDETLADEPAPASGAAAEEEMPAGSEEEGTPIDLESEHSPGSAGPASTDDVDDIPVVDLDLAEDWVEGSPEAAFAHAEAEPAAPEPAAPEPAAPESARPESTKGGDESADEAADEMPPVIDLEEPEAAPTAPGDGAAAPMDAEELDDLIGDGAAEEPAVEPGPEPETESQSEPSAGSASTSAREPGEAPGAADESGEPPEGLHPLEADESAAWDEFEDDVADLLNDVDEVGTKLDLARAYIDMGDAEGARGILEEVVEEGNEEQQQEARSLLDQGPG